MAALSGVLEEVERLLDEGGCLFVCLVGWLVGWFVCLVGCLFVCLFVCFFFGYFGQEFCCL